MTRTRPPRSVWLMVWPNGTCMSYTFSSRGDASRYGSSIASNARPVRYIPAPKKKARKR